MGFEGDAKQFAQFAVEVGEIALRMVERDHGQVGHALETLGEQAHDDTLAGARVALDQGEAALAHQVVLDAPEEVLRRSGQSQGLGGQFL